jgi:stage II sporulation protein D
MSQLLICLLSLISVTKSFTIRIFAAERPQEVVISSSQGTYTVKASGDGLLVNGKRESYFQQMGAPKYTLWAGTLKRSYAGGFTFFGSGGELFVINYIPEEAYLASVVSSEMPSAGAEALKAQAILARTYAYRNMGEHDAGYELLDSQLSQVYRGLPVSQDALNAVKDTEGLLLGYKGDIAEVYYHSTCGGMTLLPSDLWEGAKDQPYHRRMRDTLCRNSPLYVWEDTFRLDSLFFALSLRALPDSARLLRDTIGTPVKGFVLYAPDSIYFSYNDLVNSLDHRPKTRRFEAEIRDRLLLIHGHGYGHAVGMCQMGAIAMAKAGANYRDILFHYFPGTEIMAVSSIK